MVLIALICSSALMMLHQVHVVKGDAAIIAGYLPLSDVTEYAEIDLDIQALSNNLTTASYWYSVGGNSVKSDSTIRTLKGLSTNTANLIGTKW